MTERTTPCNDERLRLLLSGELPPELDADVTDHVATCPSCRRKLESLAGDQDWWTEVKSCFSQNAGLIAASRSSDTSHASNRSDHSGENESYAADFAVDFLQPCAQPETLGRLGDIEILEVIGRGGMGLVLKGYQRELGRYVAVKVMAPHLAASGAARKRLAREARAAAAIVHPHVMPIHSVNSSGRLPYLVMPLVACESLQQRLERQGPLELKEILRIGRQVAAGLAAAHAQGLVHRDVKPANILLERGVDRAMLTDFGLARAVDDASLTRTGVIAGTPQFMSPEQARGESIDARSDLFSLGSVLYAMCTGRPPFRAETSFGVLRRITDVEPRSIREINPDIPDWLVAIVSRLHAKNPAERFQSAAEIAELLEACLSHVQQPTAVPLPETLKSIAPSVPPKRLRKHVAAWIGPIGAACLVVVGIIFAFPNRPATDTPQVRRSHATASSPVRGAPSTSETTSPRAEWNDGVDEQIRTLKLRADSLEKRVQQLWDESASSHIGPLEQEFRPRSDQEIPP